MDGSLAPRSREGLRPLVHNTPEEIKELRQEAEHERPERYRRAYEMLNLKVVAYPDGTLEISWTGGSCKLSGTRW
jgi:hypothetical protein